MDEHDSIPPRLASEFDRMRTPMAIARDLDESVLIEAKAILSGRFARRRMVKWIGAGALAAAACMAVVLRLAPMSQPTQVALRDDLNHDGKIDIVDAFYLAKRLDQQSPKSCDLNGDGVVDQRDVNAIARDAVSVGGAS